MLKRAKISVTRRKSKTIIFFLFLFIVANLVLSSISIKNATEESMKMARVSLGSEVILQTDMEKIRDEFMNNKDNEQSTDENKKDDMKNMHNAMDESAATINDVNKLKEISYVTDVKYYFNVNATEKSFSLYESSSEDNNNNDRPEFDKKMNSGLQVKAINTFKADKNIKLATYASRCIENEILMTLRKKAKSRKEISLDEPLNKDTEGNELLLRDVIPSNDASASEELEKSEAIRKLEIAVNSLKPREKEILAMRFGLFDHEELTQKDTANLLGISQSYISRLEKRIIKKLRASLTE